MKYTIFPLLLAILLVGCGREETVTAPANQPTATVPDGTKPEVPPAEEQPPEVLPEPVKLPATFLAPISFAAQAPSGNWDLPYQEACEEASLILVNNYFKENTPWTIPSMEAAINKMVEWETEKHGFYTDTTAEEVVAMAKDYFNLNAELVTDVSVDRIKQELVAGNLIIAPFAGQVLDNKYYTAPGPLYHMLVIHGYDRNEFITADVGTRHGEKYEYSYKRLLNAIHDLPRNADGSAFRPYDDKSISEEAKSARMLEGEKVMIVVRRTE